MSAQELRELFAHSRAPSFGVEEEVMLLDPDTLDLAPLAGELLGGFPRDDLKLELPASQLELVSAPRSNIAELLGDLASARRRLSDAVGARAGLASAGAHPFARAQGELNTGAHYARIEREYGPIARRQLVCGLHVHVGLSGAERALAVYNAMRGYLPELAALGANAPLRGGREAGVASVRPFISGLLPRQGVPPQYAGWEELAGDLAWGERAGRLVGLAGWWWELRIHALLGTIEVRVPDAQASARDAGALVAASAGLVLWLAALHDAGELGPPAPSWRIAENRWSAARHGIHGEMFDLRTGTPAPTGERLHELLEAVRPFAAQLGAGEEIERAHALAERNGADRQLEIARESGPLALAQWLSASFLEGTEDADTPATHRPTNDAPPGGPS